MGIKRQLVQSGVLFCMWLLFPCIVIAQEPLPTVVWISLDDDSDSANALFQALRAQLSGTPVVLKQVIQKIGDIENPSRDETLLRISTEQVASLVFWAEYNADADNEIHTFYYLPGANGGQLIDRTLHVDADTPATRQEYIAISTAGMVERLHISQKIKPRPPNEPNVPAPVSPTPALEQPEPITHKNATGDIQLLYEVIRFAEGGIGQGIGIGGWFSPLTHFSAGVSFTRFFPISLENAQLTLSFTARVIAFFVAGKLQFQRSDIRLGVGWALDVRSFDTQLKSDTLQNTRSGRNTSHSLAPFITASYYLTDHFGIFTKLAGFIAVIDKNYNFEIDGTTYLAQKPSPFKLNLGAGFTIKF